MGSLESVSEVTAHFFVVYIYCLLTLLGVGQWPRLEWLHLLLDPLSTSLSFRGIRCFHSCCEIH